MLTIGHFGGTLIAYVTFKTTHHGVVFYGLLKLKHPLAKQNTANCGAITIPMVPNVLDSSKKILGISLNSGSFSMETWVGAIVEHERYQKRSTSHIVSTAQAYHQHSQL